MKKGETICAISTPAGTGAIAVIRLAGIEAFAIADKMFSPRTSHKRWKQKEPYRIYFGDIIHEENKIDEVLISLFKAPHSYTGTDTVEISCHGSSFIQQAIMKVCIANGARLAEPGEFTLMAFMNGKMDLAQAEGVADLIAGESASAHRIALHQMRGGVSDELKNLRQQLIDFAALIELELDFSEEDVEFADRTELIQLIDKILAHLEKLSLSFETGNAIKNGIGTAIIGMPNVGKSTLLNALLNEEKAIVSDIAGTTRDVVEDTLIIEGLQYRLMDTAGLRHSTDAIEQEGVSRSKAKAQEAQLVIYVFDLSKNSLQEVKTDVETLKLQNKTKIILVGNKSDLAQNISSDEIIAVSAKEKTGLDALRKRMTVLAGVHELKGDVTITSLRHFDALNRAIQSLLEVKEGFLKQQHTDIIAIDLKAALYSLGEITGTVYNDEVLASIFSKFCIGK